VELDRLLQLALLVPEIQASNQRVFMDKGEFNRWLFEVMNTVTLVAERRGRILGFLYATLEETSARIVLFAVLPEYRRRGIGTALHQELKAYIPKEEVAFVGRYALLDSPVIPLLEKVGYIPGKQYLWFDRYA
jgi:GNAT superfamily N-acetyltransferase